MAAAIGGLHDARYCEILELRGAPPKASVTVWNTIGSNDCPADWWDAFVAPDLALERGAGLVVLNGPRHWLIDRASSPATGPTRDFHGEKMTKVATITVRSADDLVQTPYRDRTINRRNLWQWRAGREVYELAAPGGDRYVMQSYSQIVNRSLTLDDLDGLDLDLPPGWRYRTRTLRRPLTLGARGSATILQDELQNTYQLAHAARRSRGRRTRPVDLDARIRTVGQPSPGVLEDRGTVSGTPFGKGRIVLRARLGADALDATFRMVFRRGEIQGSGRLPFTISGDEIDIRGPVKVDRGTGAFRGVTGRLRVHDTNTLDGQNGVVSATGSLRY
jgi:hypothetical protein